MHPEDAPLVTLRGYIIFWGCAFTLVTLAIALWKHESDHYTEARERRRQRQRKAKHPSNGSAKISQLRSGQSAASGEEGAEGSVWSQRRAEIFTAYSRLWEVVSSMQTSVVSSCGMTINGC